MSANVEPAPACAIDAAVVKTACPRAHGAPPCGTACCTVCFRRRTSEVPISQPTDSPDWFRSQVSICGNLHTGNYHMIILRPKYLLKRDGACDPTPKPELHPQIAVSERACSRASQQAQHQYGYDCRLAQAKRPGRSPWRRTVSRIVCWSSTEATNVAGILIGGNLGRRQLSGQI